MEKALSWEIDNVSERNSLVPSDPFSSGGCEWFINLRPKDPPYNFSMALNVSNPNSLSPGWKRRASFRFVLLNQSGKELYRSPGRLRLFKGVPKYWGYGTGLILTDLQKQGLLENNKLTIEVYINVVEAVPQVKSTTKDMLAFNCSQILSSQAVSVSRIYAEHPDQEVKTAYMSLLLSLIETLSKSPQSLSVTELTNAQSKLTELKKAGFKLDWLNSKLKEVLLERTLSDGSRFQQLEERVRDVELTLSDLKVQLGKEKIKSFKLSSFEVIDLLIKRFFLSCFSIPKY